MRTSPEWRGYGRRMPDGSREDHAVHRRARDGRGNRHHVDRRGHGQIRVPAVPQGQRGAARFWHRVAPRDASRAHTREQLDRGNAIGFAVTREEDKVTSATAAATPATRPPLCSSSTPGSAVSHRADQRPRLRARRNRAAIDAHRWRGRRQASTRPRTDHGRRIRPGHASPVLYRARGGDAHVVELNERLVIMVRTQPTWRTRCARSPRRRTVRCTARTGGGPSARWCGSQSRTAAWFGCTRRQLRRASAVSSGAGSAIRSLALAGREPHPAAVGSDPAARGLRATASAATSPCTPRRPSSRTARVRAR